MIYEATKKPVTVQAFHYTDPNQIKEIVNWAKPVVVRLLKRPIRFPEPLVIEMAGEDNIVWFNYWIIKSPNGEVSTCPDSTFTSLYDYKLWEAE